MSNIVFLIIVVSISFIGTILCMIVWDAIKWVYKYYTADLKEYDYILEDEDE